MAKKMSDSFLYVNLACGGSYVDSPEWVNLDYFKAGPGVKKVNLLDSLPFEDKTVDAIYCSHFIEHIPRDRLNNFLKECYRILKSGTGMARFVLPDFEEMCTEYIRQRKSGNHAKADFVVLEIIDQCVRMEQGGELGALYKSLDGSNDNDFIGYIYERCGKNALLCCNDQNGEDWRTRLSRHYERILSYIEKKYCRLVSMLFPSAFKAQNVSFAAVGEKHAWLYDEYSLAVLLKKAGFSNIVKMAYDKTFSRNNPFYLLDVDVNGLPREGKESMYIEAFKK